MTEKPTWHDELLRLCGAVRDETLAPDDRVQLERLLRQDPDARTYYVRFFQLDACLQWQSFPSSNTSREDFDFLGDVELVRRAADSANSAAGSLPPPTTRRGAQVLGFLSNVAGRSPGGGIAVGSLVIFVVVAAFWGLALQMLHPRKPSAWNDNEMNDALVATISDAADVHWSSETKSKSGKSAIHLGESLKISSGIVQLNLKTGATLVVEGPAEWSIDGANRATLESGKIVANIPSQAVGFTIRTPTATVIDLGTEFGVEVTKDQESRLHVFKGKVVVRANRSATSADAASGEVELHEGEVATVQAQGATILRSRAEAPAAASASRFVRKVPGKIIKIVNLVDVVAGGDGFGRARDRGIDPTSGKATAVQVRVDRAGLSGDGGYHRVEELPFVDGVFIPRGKAPVQLDSAGHTFAGFPHTDNNTWGQIWAGGVIPSGSVDGANQGTISASLEGVDYGTDWHSLLSVHANKGITFDLEAIRRTNQQRTILRFVTVAGNAASVPLQSDATPWCDVWVFVDGQPRFSRERITAQHEFKIAVELKDQDRFLSLVATDGGDGFGWDHVIFVDPCLVLSQTVAEEPTAKAGGRRVTAQEAHSFGEKGVPTEVEKKTNE